MKLSDLQLKDVVSMSDGRNLGRIVDVEITEEGIINNFVIERKRFFWKLFFSSNSEVFVKVSQIKKIGSDVILVEVSDNF